MKISRTELQRIIREEKVRLRREDKRSASRNSGSISGGAGKKSRANRLRRLEEKRKILREGQAQEEALFDALDQYVMVLDEEMGYDVSRDELKAEVLNFVDGYFEEESHWDEADQDHADQQYAEKHGNPWDE